jgi:hypothetical protein
VCKYPRTYLYRAARTRVMGAVADHGYRSHYVAGCRCIYCRRANQLYIQGRRRSAAFRERENALARERRKARNAGGAQETT